MSAAVLRRASSSAATVTAVNNLNANQSISVAVNSNRARNNSNPTSFKQGVNAGGGGGGSGNRFLKSLRKMHFFRRQTVDANSRIRQPLMEDALQTSNVTMQHCDGDGIDGVAVANSSNSPGIEIGKHQNSHVLQGNCEDTDVTGGGGSGGDAGENHSKIVIVTTTAVYSPQNSTCTYVNNFSSDDGKIVADEQL